MMGLPRDKWAIALVNTLGNVNPTVDTLSFVGGWEAAEGTQALNNPLATTQPMPGSTNFNALGVQNYKSGQDGLTATVMSIRNGRYNSLLHALMTNDENGLGFHGHAIATDIQGDLTMWATGQRSPIDTQYVNNIWSASSGKGDTTSGTSPISTSAANANATPGDSLAALNTWISNLSSPAFIKRLALGAIGLIAMLAGMALMLAIFTGKGNGVSNTVVKGAKFLV